MRKSQFEVFAAVAAVGVAAALVFYIVGRLTEERVPEWLW